MNLDQELRQAAGEVDAPLASPQQARARAERRRRQQRWTTGVSTALAAVAVLALVGLNLGDRNELVPDVTASPPTATPPPTVTTPPPDAVLELRGASLGVTEIGAPKQQAVDAVTRVLGKPLSLHGSYCFKGASGVTWKDLELAFDEHGRLDGWVTKTTRLSTPSGVRVGTTVTRLKQVYGSRLILIPANPDNPPSYQVSGVDMFGYLSGADDSSKVVALGNGSCSGP